MPYSKNEKKLYASLVAEYGDKKAEEVYHAMINSKKHDKMFSKKTLRRRDMKMKKRLKKRVKRSMKDFNFG